VGGGATAAEGEGSGTAAVATVARGGTSAAATGAAPTAGGVTGATDAGDATGAAGAGDAAARGAGGATGAGAEGARGGAAATDGPDVVDACALGVGRAADWFVPAAGAVRVGASGRSHATTGAGDCFVAGPFSATFAGGVRTAC